jgi:hypothetical protein
MLRTTIILVSLGALMSIFGCESDPKKKDKAPILQAAVQLENNAGEKIRIVGTARYMKTTGPTIAGADFEIKVYPKDVWGPEMDGKQVEVTGRLNDSRSTTPPDPSINPGEYWLSDATWMPVPPPPAGEAK